MPSIGAYVFARVLAVSAGLVLVAALAWQNGLGRLDAALYDSFSKHLAKPAVADIVMVAIDDRSLASVGRWPWSRDQISDLLERVAGQGPAAIGLDLLLSEPSRDPEEDKRLAAAMQRSGNIVLPVFTAGSEQGNVQAMLPIKPFAQAAKALGHVAIEADPDGVVRSIFLREGPPERMWQHFSVELLRVAGRDVPEPLPGSRAPANLSRDHGGSWLRDHWMLIAFSGPARSYRTISASDVLSGEVDSKALAGRIVFIGASATGLGDVYPTPLSGPRRYTPGMEVSANIAGNLLSDTGRTHVAAWQNLLFTVLLLCALLPALWLLSPVWALLSTIFGLALAVAGSYWILGTFGLWLAPGAALLVMGASYLLWNWRRLQHAASYMVEELSRLRRYNPGFIPKPRQKGQDLIARRINELAGAAGQLREGHAFISSVLESLPDIAIVADASGRALLGNHIAHRYFSLTAETLPTQSVEDLLAGFTLHSGALLYARSALKPDVQADLRSEVECRDAKGRDFLFKRTPCAGLDESADIFSLVDITSLREAERRRDEALRFLSHDIRSPQGAVLALLDLYQSDPRELPQAELLTRIRKYVLRTQGLADSFVELARLESVPTRHVEIDLVDVLFDAVDECWGLAQVKGIELRTQVPADVALMLGERDLLTRAAINLLNNAIKFSPSDSVIDCAINRSGLDWRLSVRDQGCGIAEQDLARLFLPFARFSGASRTEGDGGFGLGLAFAKTVVERHQGRILCNSRVGQGSEFQIYFPVLDANIL